MSFGSIDYGALSVERGSACPGMKSWVALSFREEIVKTLSVLALSLVPMMPPTSADGATFLRQMSQNSYQNIFEMFVTHANFLIPT